MVVKMNKLGNSQTSYTHKLNILLTYSLLLQTCNTSTQRHHPLPPVSPFLSPAVEKGLRAETIKISSHSLVKQLPTRDKRDPLPFLVDECNYKKMERK